MDIGVAESRDCAVEAPGTGPPGVGADAAVPHLGLGWDEPTRPSVELRVTEDRVLIRADQEDHAPTQTDAGLFLAQSLAAAVGGEDPSESWFVGTIVQLGPLVNQLDIRNRVIRWLHELEDEGHDLRPAEIGVVRERIEALPREMPDPLRVGDRVVFSWASGQQIAVDGERRLILRASDVLAVLEE